MYSKFYLSTYVKSKVIETGNTSMNILPEQIQEAIILNAKKDKQSKEDYFAELLGYKDIGNLRPSQVQYVYECLAKGKGSSKLTTMLAKENLTPNAEQLLANGFKNYNIVNNLTKEVDCLLLYLKENNMKVITLTEKNSLSLIEFLLATSTTNRKAKDLLGDESINNLIEMLMPFKIQKGSSVYIQHNTLYTPNNMITKRQLFDALEEQISNPTTVYNPKIYTLLQTGLRRAYSVQGYLLANGTLENILWLGIVDSCIRLKSQGYFVDVNVQSPAQLLADTECVFSKVQGTDDIVLASNSGKSMTYISKNCPSIEGVFVVDKENLKKVFNKQIQYIESNEFGLIASIAGKRIDDYLGVSSVTKTSNGLTDVRN